ncbi:MAG TPA: hypothetical protein VHZ55_09615 [Bryobacteraceae bacterium]|jgi:hypothetical protein|nr:hypothetical protein [Bryobacteraceae bacterium]
MKVDFGPMILVLALAVTGIGWKAWDQTAGSPQNPSATGVQTSPIRWKFDTHG